MCTSCLMETTVTGENNGQKQRKNSKRCVEFSAHLIVPQFTASTSLVFFQGARFIIGSATTRLPKSTGLRKDHENR